MRDVLDTRFEKLEIEITKIETRLDKVTYVNPTSRHLVAHYVGTTANGRFYGFLQGRT